MLISIQVREKTSGSGRSAEAAVFISGLYVVYKNPTQAVTTIASAAADGTPADGSRISNCI